MAGHLANGVLNLGILGLVVSVVLFILRAFGVLPPSWTHPMCPVAFCPDGLAMPFYIDAGAAAECGAVFGVVLLAAGVVASAMLTWQLLLVASAAALGQAQHMVGRLHSGLGSFGGPYTWTTSASPEAATTCAPGPGAAAPTPHVPCLPRLQIENVGEAPSLARARSATRRESLAVGSSGADTGLCSHDEHASAPIV